jgi:hemerythrin superfamily protein
MMTKSSEQDSQQEMEVNAVAMLKKDHQKVAQLFEEFERSPEADRASIATQIFNELEVHATLEEEIFYPAVRDGVDLGSLMEEEELDEDDAADDESPEEDDESEDIIAVSIEEHQEVRDLIKQLRKMDPSAKEFVEVFAELREAVQDHVAEEEDLILPAAQMKLDVETLGTQMEQRRITLVSSMAA